MAVKAKSAVYAPVAAVTLTKLLVSAVSKTPLLLASENTRTCATPDGAVPAKVRPVVFLV